MRIADYRGTDGIELIADILMPIVNICNDPDIKNGMREGLSNLEMFQRILKTHAKDVLEILAIVDQEDPETYNPSIYVLPARLIELFDQPEFKVLFTGQGQKIVSEFSGSATENTEEVEK